MLNNPLLLASSFGGGNIFNVTVATWVAGGDFPFPCYGYSAYDGEQSYGEIFPGELPTGERIVSISLYWTEGKDASPPEECISSLNTDKSLVGKNLFIGRYDTNFSPVKVTGTYNQVDDTAVFIFVGKIFTPSDLGKTVPVWISTEPPPY